MDRATKERTVEEIKTFMLGSNAVVLTDYRGMTVEDMFALRRQCREAGVSYRVVKNTLARLAIAGTDYEVLSDAFEGPVGIAYSEDPIAPAKVLANFIKECEHLTLRLGYMDGNLLSDTDITRLSKLPGKDELRAQLLSVFNATASKFVGVLAAVPRDFLGVLTARKDAL